MISLNIEYGTLLCILLQCANMSNYLNYLFQHLFESLHSKVKLLQSVYTEETCFTPSKYFDKQWAASL